MAIDPMQEIEDLVAFDGRWPGTDAERRAALHLEGRLNALGRDAEVEIWVFPAPDGYEPSLLEVR